MNTGILQGLRIVPFRWLFIDGFYLIYAITKGDKVSRPFLIQSCWFAALFVSFIDVLTLRGYGLDGDALVHSVPRDIPHPGI